MKDLLTKAQEQTLTAFRSVYDLVDSYTDDDVPPSYRTVERLLLLADDILRRTLKNDESTQFTWQQIKAYIEGEYA